MRLSLVAVTVVAFLLIACNGPSEATRDVGPEGTPVETSEVAEPSPAAATPTPGPDNTFVETSEYTGVIFSESGALEFSYLLDGATEFWEPTAEDVSRAEKSIKQFLASYSENPKLDSYQRENVTFIQENLKEYRRQYVGKILDGEKRIWVNSFFSVDSFPEWKHRPVDVDGGGRHYWQIEYDLLKDECLDFYVHGES